MAHLHPESIDCRFLCLYLALLLKQSLEQCLVLLLEQSLLGSWIACEVVPSLLLLLGQDLYLIQNHDNFSSVHLVLLGSPSEAKLGSCKYHLKLCRQQLLLLIQCRTPILGLFNKITSSLMKDI